MAVKITFLDGEDHGSTAGAGPFDSLEFDAGEIRGVLKKDRIVVAEVLASETDGVPVFRFDDGTGVTEDFRRWTISSA